MSERADNRLRCPSDGWGLEQDLDGRLLCCKCDAEFELVEYRLAEVSDEGSGGFS